MLCGQLAQSMQGEGISRGQQDISQREQLDGQVDDIEGADGNSDDDMRMMIKNYITKDKIIDLKSRNSNIVPNNDSEMDTGINRISASEDCNYELEQDSNYDSELPFLLRLSWDYVLYRSLLPLLAIDDMFRLRATSRTCHEMVNGYFDQLRTLNVSAVGSRFTTNAFKVCKN